VGRIEKNVLSSLAVNRLDLAGIGQSRLKNLGSCQL